MSPRSCGASSSRWGGRRSRQRWLRRLRALNDGAEQDSCSVVVRMMHWKRRSFLLMLATTPVLPIAVPRPWRLLLPPGPNCMWCGVRERPRVERRGLITCEDCVGTAHLIFHEEGTPPPTEPPAPWLRCAMCNGGSWLIAGPTIHACVECMDSAYAFLEKQGLLRWRKRGAGVALRAA